jgi:three-Cys-motif partner protein
MTLAMGSRMAREKFFSEASQNSQVKAAIISKYFWVWAKILSNVGGGAGNKVAYIDLFAGPGRYEDGTKSTPLLILEKAAEEPAFRENLVTLFNDSDPDHASSLKTAIASIPGIATLRHAPRVENNVVGEEITQQLASMKLIPTLCFVDPFGYKGLSLRLVNAVVKDFGSECLFFFNYNRINMGLSNPLVKEHMAALFGEQRAEKLRTRLEGLTPDDRELAVVEELVEALKEMGGTYVLPFRFKAPNGVRTSHHLIFVGKHVLGYDIMKGIMAKESSSQDQGVPSFEYSAADERYPLLFELSRPLDALEGMLLTDFAGQTLTMAKIYEQHNIDRPYIAKNYKDALGKLEAKNAITAEPPAAKRPKRLGAVTFSDKVVVSFPKRST